LRKVCFIYTNFLVDIAQKYHSNNTWPSEDVIAVEIIGFNSPKVNGWVDSVLTEAERKYEDTMAFRLNTEKMFKDGSSLERKIKDFALSKKATLDDIFSHFYKHIHLLQNEEDPVEDLISTLKTKFFAHVSKYTNDFVEPVYKQRMTMIPLVGNNLSGDHSKNSLKKSATTQNPFAMVQAEIANAIESAREKSMAEVTSLNSKQENNHRAGVNNLDNSYFSEKEEKVERGKKMKKHNYFGYSKNKEEDVEATYRRINDLNRLELGFFKVKDKNAGKVNNSLFSEIFFNFKKKLSNSKPAGSAAVFNNSKNAPKPKLKTKNSIDSSVSNNYMLTSEAGISTRIETKSKEKHKWYKPVQTEPDTLKKKSVENKINKANEKKKKRNLMKEFLSENVLQDNEKLINTLPNWNKNSKLKEINTFVKKLNKQKDKGILILIIIF
jgi:hypothetical protein